MTTPVLDRNEVIPAWLGKRETWTAPVNYISGAGHPCDRYLYLNRTEGDKKSPPSEFLAAIFKRGDHGEEVGKAQILAAGWEIYEQQVRYDIVENGEILWRGRPDGVIRNPRLGPYAPVHVWDVKVINTHQWKALNTLDDIKNSTRTWVRGYPDQLMMYMYKKAAGEVGILHLLDSETWLPKFIEVPMDYARCQELLDRGRRINAAVRAGESPPPIDWGQTCERCDLLSVCMPNLMASAAGLRVWDEPGFEAKLLRREQLKAQLDPLKKAFDAIDKEVKVATVDQGEIACGDFWINTKTKDVKEFTVKARTDHIVEVKRIRGEVPGTVELEVDVA